MTVITRSARPAALVTLTATFLALLLTATLGVAAASANGPHQPTCATLPRQPLLAHNPAIKAVNTQTVLAGKTPVAPPQGTPPTGTATVNYCLATLVYGTSANENITIYVGLPLSAADGGGGAYQGNWNGRTEGLGGGGCAGNTNVTAAVNGGYVGSGTDGGHAGGDCTPGVNADGTYNATFIEDFFRVGIKQEILWSKRIAEIYYGERILYNYWNGCSTGGRQGYLLAQELGDELDGILASAPAMYWTRFQTAQMWGQLAMLDLAGESPAGPIPAGKAAAVQQAATAACDLNDGVQDGIIDDPRTCHYDANNAICGQPGAPAAPNCLTVQEAVAVNKVWDGPRNNLGNRIWFGLDHGSDFNILDGSAPFALGVIQFEWDEHDRSFGPPTNNWKNVTLSGGGLSYPRVAQDGSTNIVIDDKSVADVTDTFGDLDTFKSHGGRMITFVGANDQFIYPRGVLNYYRQMAARYRLRHDPTGWEGVQDFYRLFHVPGVGHCGFSVLNAANGQLGPWPQNGVDFAALIDWVENGIAPSEVIGTGRASGPTAANPKAPAVPLMRPVCPYPQTARYIGPAPANSSTNPAVNVAANWVCGGNLETPAVVCPDVLVKYKHEENGGLDFRGSGVNHHVCRVPDHDRDDDDRDRD